MICSLPTHSEHRHRGSIFVMTLAILIVLTSLALVLSRTMSVEAASTANYVSQLQAESVATGAIAYIKTKIDGNEGKVPDDSELLAEGVPVGDGFFWILKKDFEDDTTYAFGLTDEQGKFNLNFTELEVLANLPGMTIDLAGGISDWHDNNEEAEAGGAESAYYSMLDTPYNAKNEAFESVGELELIKGMTAEILRGEDSNQNGVLDDNEDDGDESDPPDNRDGKLEYGLNSFVTVYTSQDVLDSTGQTKINVNTGNQINAVIAEAVEPSRVGQIVSDIRRNRPFTNLVDFYYRSGLKDTEFEKIEDRLTVGATQARGKVNINTAPRQVLAAMPNMTESDVQRIMDTRTSGEPLESLSDVIKLLDRDKAISIGGLVTTKSYRFSADIVAVDGKGRSFKRFYVVFDAQTSPPRVLYMRDLTSLGWPLDPQIVEDLKAGQAPAASSSVINY